MAKHVAGGAFSESFFHLLKARCTKSTFRPGSALGQRVCRHIGTLQHCVFDWGQREYIRCILGIVEYDIYIRDVYIGLK